MAEEQKFEHYYNLVFTNKKNENNFALFLIPKNGSTTIRKTLNIGKKNYYSKLKKNLDSYEKIIVLRDPLYRAASIYNEVMKLRFKKSASITRSLKCYEFRHDLEKSFAFFLDEIENFPFEPHINYQYLTLENKNVTLEDMNYIFLFEELDNDLIRFCRHQNIRYNHNSENLTPIAKKEFLHNLIDTNPEIQNKIRRLWAKDFEFYEKAKLQRKKILRTTYKS